VQGVTNITTDANGNYSVTIPNGNYTLTFAKTNYTSQTAGTIAVVATQTKTTNISLVPAGPAVVNAGADKTGQALGAAVPLSATVEVFDPTLTGTPTFSWTQTSGPAATITGAATATPTVTLAGRSAYKDYLVQKNAVRQGLEPPAQPPEEEGGDQDIPIFVPLDRLMVQPINPFSLEESNASVFQVTATINGQAFTDTVSLIITPPFGPATGLRNVPIGQPVLLHGRNGQVSYSWTITSAPAGSAAALNDAANQNPDFTPVVAGKYTINEATGGSLDIYAGTWFGVFKQDGTPDDTCLACHNNVIASDNFTPWKATGHSMIMKNAINDPAGHWSATSCGPCHTVGYNQLATAVLNGGWDQVSKAEGFTFTQGPNAWANTLSKFPNTARLSNIQCENCHGPQSGDGAHTLGLPAPGAPTATVASARVSFAGALCGSCHGEPARHGRYQEWRESGHGDYETAINEGWSGAAINAGCGACHVGQGFLQWYQQLANVGVGRKIGSRTLDATSLANLSTLTQDQVEPQTCAVCHDPHDEGVAKGSLPGKLNNAKIRITDNTSLLPAGFIANGLGRGALCITCHNSRNGEPVSGQGNPTLHEEGDINWGTKVSSSGTPAGTSYASPHEAAQGDVLMGRNAYYVTGARSKHSFIADTCATCHMELTTPPAEFSSEGIFGTNHSFAASLTICGSCHGSFTSGTVQESFTARLADLDKAVQRAIYKVKNGVNPPAGTTIVIVFGRSPTISVNGAAAQTFTAYLTGVAGLTNGFHLDIAKANWNYNLVNLDASKGIHNPSFTFEVLDATIAKMNTL
jgi:hypothetical protein